jgi:putative ATP-binding cassette transporter
MQISRKILAVPLAHIEELGAPRLMSILTGDIPTITSVVTVVPILCINLAVLAGGLVYLGWLSWQVLLVVIGFIAVGIVGVAFGALGGLVFFGQFFFFVGASLLWCGIPTIICRTR